MFVVSIFTEKLLWVIYGWYETCKLLLQNIEEKNATMDNGNTPLHTAASNGHFEICKLIFQFNLKIKDLLDWLKNWFFLLQVFYTRIGPHSENIYSYHLGIFNFIQQSPKMCVMRKLSSTGNGCLEGNHIFHRN